MLVLILVLRTGTNAGIRNDGICVSFAIAAGIHFGIGIGYGWIMVMSVLVLALCFPNRNLIANTSRQQWGAYVRQ